MIERFSCPENTNKFYIKSPKGYNPCIYGNPKTRHRYLNVLPNCVGYAWGRFNEILGGWSYYCKGNAEDLYDNAKKIGLNVGYTPRLGGIMVWRKGEVGNGSDGAGHVAVVERIVTSSEIITSESEYNGRVFRTYTRTNKNKNWSDNIGWQKDYVYLGCIYSPVEQMEINSLKALNYKGEVVEVEAVNIDGTNFIKMRDIPALIPCNVTYNSVKRMPEVKNG